jgi:hypothetical protein
MVGATAFLLGPLALALACSLDGPSSRDASRELLR